MYTAANHPERIKDANRYLNNIRNTAKRRYGFAYLAWMHNGGSGLEPEHPGLSTLGAQAVRQRLSEFRLWDHDEKV